ncbi:4744_t:CDS:2, partial [Gigaspora rosea]
ETERKNKIKNARAQGIAPPPKCKNINPPTSRFKNTTFQSSKTNSDIAKVNDEIDGSLIESNRNDSPSYYSITYNNTDIPKSPTITPRIIRSSKSSKIPVGSLATSSNSIKVRRFELNSDDYTPEPSTTIDDSSDYNDASELSTITSHTIKLSTPSRIQTRLLTTSSNMIETGNSNINNDNDISEFFTISPLARRSSRSSNPVQLPYKKFLTDRFRFCSEKAGTIPIVSQTKNLYNANQNLMLILFQKCF